LAELYKRNVKKGFVAVAIHAQAGSDEEIKEWCEDRRVEMPVARSGRSPIDFNGIPKMFVFDHAGKLIFDGQPGEEADRLIKKALRDVPDAETAAGTAGSTLSSRSEPLIAERTWTNADGRSLTAALLSVSGESATFRRPDGRTFSYEITQLSEDDQKLIREKAAAKEE
jgi:hypothetical protein